MIAEPGLGVPGAIAGTMSQYRLDARRQAEKYRRTRACTVARPYSEGISVGVRERRCPRKFGGNRLREGTFLLVPRGHDSTPAAFYAGFVPSLSAEGGEACPRCFEGVRGRTFSKVLPRKCRNSGNRGKEGGKLRHPVAVERACLPGSERREEFRRCLKTCSGNCGAPGSQRTLLLNLRSQSNSLSVTMSSMRRSLRSRWSKVRLSR